MPDAPAISRPDVKAIAARAEAATPGDWIAKGMGSHSYVLAPTHRWHRPSLCKRGYPIAIPRPYQDMDGRQTIDFSSAGFAHDDAKFIAHARQDIPALIARIEALEAVIQERDDADQKVWKEAEEVVAELDRLEALAALGDGDG